MASKDSFGARADLEVGGTTYEIFRVDAVEGSARLPYTHKVLLENLLRTEDGANVTADQIRALGCVGPDRGARPRRSSSRPARVIMQDFTGVPCVVDLATMREADEGPRRRPGEDQPARARPSSSSTTRSSPTSSARRRPPSLNVELEYERNRERYQFLRWGQTAFDEFKVVPPGTGIVHQVNIEYLARVVMARNGQAYPDTCVGTDSHTTMVNGLGVLGWGVGGIEAEAAMLGQPVSMLIPRVVGFKLTGDAARGRHRHRPRAHDHRDAAQARRGRQVRRVLRRRRLGGAAGQPRHHRQHEPGVRLDRRDLPDRRRDAALPAAHRSHRRAGRARRGLRQGAGPLARPDARAGLLRATSSSTSATVVPSLAGPKRPQDRVILSEAARGVPRGAAGVHRGARDDRRASRSTARRSTIGHGAVAIAAITSCTNTSNPSVMIGAGAAGEEGRREGPDPQAVGQDHARARLEGRHRLLRQGRPHALPGEAGLRPRRLRLHDLHRQLRPAARGGQRGGQRRRPRGRVGAVRQPQLRGPHQPRRQDELPRVAAAGRGLRDRGHDGHRHHDRAARHRRRRQPGLPARHLAVARRGAGHHRRRDRRRHVHHALRRRLRRRRALALAADARPATRSPGTTTRPTCASPRTSTGMAAQPVAGHRHRRCPGAGQARRLGHHRPHQPGGQHQGRHARRRRTSPSTASSARTSTPTARAAATTRS